MVHQTSKLPKAQWDEYLEWIYDFEFNKLGLPVPDLTIYLRMPVDVSEQLLSKRYGNDDSKRIFMNATSTIFAGAKRAACIPPKNSAGR